MYTIEDLYDLSHTLAGDYLAQFTYPWEALAGIKALICELGPTLGDDYEEVQPQVWVHKTAKVFPSAYLGAPCIIGPNTEVRHCAFVRGSALVGADCVVGNSAVVGYAMSKIGCPYVWGAEGPDAFDCSGLVRWAYLQIGMSLPHYTESLFASATNRVPVSEARPGDVLYRPGHVGIAVGYGGVPYVHAPTFGAYVRDTDALSWSGFTYALQF